MDFSYSEDQHLLMSSVESLLDRFRDPSPEAHGYVAYSADLQAELFESGFLEVATQPGFGLLEAALLVEAVAHCPVSAEVAAAAMVAPLLGEVEIPITTAWGRKSPIRYLDQARTLVLFDGDDVLVGSVTPDIRHSVESVVAYPLASLTADPADVERYTGETAAAIRRRALIGIAAEAAGVMRGALDSTVKYVKEREQFGQPLGNFQGIQHRLAEDAQLIRACRSLAFRAAHNDGDADASLACLYAQDAVRKIIYDCHQFSGAMGLTLEFPLHLWTYRLKFLQGEMGGKIEQARQLAGRIWPARQGSQAADEGRTASVG